MIKRFDHLTIVVTDVAEAKRFFGLLGFKEVTTVVISGETFARYMGVPGIEAEHVTLVAEGVEPRTEIQLLRYLKPASKPDPLIRDLSKIGLNHICFAVEDLEGVLAKMVANGFAARNEVLDFHRRKLVFLAGPEGVTVELSQWY
jgi:catechol 2,3-dioxygenase-like lactoylglutathione lyase family enzyme